MVYIGGQALAIGAGLAHHYLQREIPPIVLAIETPQYTHYDFRYGVITKPQTSDDLPQNHTFEYKLSLVVGTTGSSGDAEMVFPV